MGMRDDASGRLPPEGDLDPDLAEAAGDSGGDRPRRRVWSIVLRVGSVLLVAALIAPLVFRALTA